MKITFCLPCPSMAGGIRNIAEIAVRLERRGHSVTIVSTPPKPVRFRRRVTSLLRGKGWQTPPAPGPSHLDGTGLAHHMIEKYRPIRDADVPHGDAVVATWWETADWVAALSPSKGAKVYLMADYGEVPGQPLDELIRTWRLPLHVVTISEWLRQLVLHHVDADVSVAPCAVDHSKFYAPPRSMPPIPTVGFVCSNAPQKGADICVAAVNFVRKTVPTLKVVSFGFRPASDGLALPEGTEFFHRASEDSLRSIYGACTAWLFGSRREGFGLPILEAMACRTPVIATPAGAANEILSKGGGILVRPEDPQDMAHAIQHICAMPQHEWRSMSDAAYDVAQAYTWEHTVDCFEAALTKAIALYPK